MMNALSATEGGTSAATPQGGAGVADLVQKLRELAEKMQDVSARVEEAQQMRKHLVAKVLQVLAALKTPYEIDLWDARFARGGWAGVLYLRLTPQGLELEQVYQGQRTHFRAPTELAELTARVEESIKTDEDLTDFLNGICATLEVEFNSLDEASREALARLKAASAALS